jgi:hypothetical protein
VGMGTGPVKPGTVRHVREFISIADLYDLLDLFGGFGHNHASRDCGHNTFISQTIFIPARPASVPLTDYGVVGEIFGANNGFQYIIYFFGYCHDLPP